MNERDTSVSFVLRMQCVQCLQKISLPFQPEMPAPWISSCPECGHHFGIASEEIIRQIRLFTALCSQIRESEEILSHATIAVAVGDKEVKIPFKLLLTRLRSTFDLEIDGHKVSISTRTEPSLAKKEDA